MQGNDDNETPENRQSGDEKSKKPRDPVLLESSAPRHYRKRPLGRGQRTAAKQLNNSAAGESYVSDDE